MHTGNRSANLDRASAQQRVNEAKGRKKEAEGRLKTAKKKEAGRVASAGKGHGIILYNETADARAAADRAQAEARAADEIAKLHHKADKIDRSTSKVNKKAEKYENGKKHGLILFNEETQEVIRCEPVIIHAGVDPHDGTMYAYEVERDGRLTRGQVQRTATQVNGSRGKAAVKADARKPTKATYPGRPSPKQMNAWARNPDRYDVIGVDAPKGAKATVRSKGAKMPDKMPRRAGSSRKADSSKGARR